LISEEKKVLVCTWLCDTETPARDSESTAAPRSGEFALRVGHVYLEIRSHMSRLATKKISSHHLDLSWPWIRLSTAIARLGLSEVVEEPDVDEAVGLYECSRRSIDEAKLGGNITCVKVLELLKELCP
jgi:DNA replicative helicase MCM subunit Mcm2 (Cdc46/Mcm family)